MNGPAQPSRHQQGTANPDVAISLSNLRHEYVRSKGSARLEALGCTSLDIARDSFVSFVGPSGCGKSTLLRIVAGLIAPTEGSVVVEGRAVSGPDAKRGMVFQQDAVFPWLTVRENVAYALRMRGVGKRERDRVADEWISLVGLRPFAESYPKELSGGMRKRVDLARSYAADPDVLLMDEPFGALDALTREQMQLELLRLWEERRRTVLFVTHDLEEALLLSDAVVVMTARPSRVHALEINNFPRPRRPELRSDPRFVAARQRLDELLMQGSAPSAGSTP
jgi:NitT/TauT family transport system ATP-binding protein